MTGRLFFTPKALNSGSVCANLATALMDPETQQLITYEMCASRTLTVRFTKRLPSDFRRGEANSDGTLDVSDGVFVLNFLFLGGPRPECLDAADVDDSGDLLLTDAVYLFRFLFFGLSPSPSAPGPLECGPDPTADRVSCDQFSACT